MPVDLLRGTLASNSVNLSSQTHPAVTGRRGHSELACVVGSASGYAGSPAGQAKGLSVCTELLKWEPSRDWLVETLPSGKAERVRTLPGFLFAPLDPEGRMEEDFNESDPGQRALGGGITQEGRTSFPFRLHFSIFGGKERSASRDSLEALLCKKVDHETRDRGPSQQPPFTPCLYPVISFSL
ncbi:unnamed protein product [Rangifer tarandus platyrhynchus]|uniref:Uncharacterized protein n=1 Tax=Rangifer tarandus platyrhynchus TaxID=3082113 RepID=A0AC59ZDA6_RANTA